MTQGERPAPCKRPPAPGKGPAWFPVGGGVGEGVTLVGKDPQARGPGQRPNSLIAWSLRPALPGEACSAARVCGKACAAAGSGLQWLLRVCHSRALSPARLAGQRQDTAGGGGAAGGSSPSPSPRRLSPLLRLLLSPSVVQEAPDSSVSTSHQGLLFISVACSGGGY